MSRGVKLKLGSEPVRFKSKRNTVILRDGVVQKHFTSASAAEFEAQVLRNLSSAGVRVPEVIALDGTVLKMRYINAETLPDIIARLETLAFDQLAIDGVSDKLVAWLDAFYRAAKTETTGEIRGDVNGRNFLLDGSGCWGVDFEERICGAKEEDVGRLIAYILTYDPPGTEVKTALADSFLRKAMDILGIDAREVRRQRDLEFAAMQNRRSAK